MTDVQPFDRMLLTSASARRVLKKWFNATPASMKLRQLPDVLLPEDFTGIHRARLHPVELMLCIMSEGGWIPGDTDWRDYARVLIGLRLRRRASKIFSRGQEEWKDRVLNFQMYGGTIEQQRLLQNHGKRIITLRTKSYHAQAFARLLLNITAPNEDLRWIQPLHSIRSVVAATDIQPILGLALYHSEMEAQKVELASLIQTSDLITLS